MDFYNNKIIKNNKLTFIDKLSLSNKRRKNITLKIKKYY